MFCQVCDLKVDTYFVFANQTAYIYVVTRKTKNDEIFVKEIAQFYENEWRILIGKEIPCNRYTDCKVVHLKFD